MQHNLRQWFGRKTYGRAEDYVKRGRVLEYSYDQEQNQLTGRVRGNNWTAYKITLDFDYVHLNGNQSSIGECSCPVGVNCKHICALLLTVIDNQGEETLQHWFEIETPHQIQQKMGGMSRRNRQIPDSSIFGGNAEKNRFNLWLKGLAPTKETIETNKPIVRAADKQSQYLLYVLQLQPHYDYLDHIGLSLHISRRLKKGGHGAPRDVGDLSRLMHGTYPPSSPEDQTLLRGLFNVGILDAFCPWQKPVLTGKQPEILFDLAHTKRLVWDVQERITINAGNPIAIQPKWFNDKRDRQNCVLCDEQGLPVAMLPTSPPVVLAQGPTQDSMTLAYPESSLSDHTLKQLYDAPPIPRSLIKDVRKTLAPLVGSDENALPREVVVCREEPVPVLVLDGIPTSDGQPVDIAARGRLFFDYGSLRVNGHDRLDPLIDDKGVQYPRDRPTEATFFEAMLAMLYPAANWQDQAEYEKSDYCGGSLSSPATDAHWIKLIESVLPLLEKQGWRVEVDESFPYNLLDIDAGDWFGEISESQEDWFGLKLGIEVDGEQLDLMPLLAAQLDRLPGLGDLGKMKDQPIPVSIGYRRFISLPAKRLRLILATLLELFSDRGTGIQRSQAPILEELSRGLGLDFSGGETLKTIARKLKNFRRIKAVKPPPDFHAELRTYQKKGLAWLQFLREMGLSGILADDMGLGKTVQALAHIQFEKERLRKQKEIMQPCLVVAPTSLMHNWRREAERFAPKLNVIVYHGTKRTDKQDALAEADLVLTTYTLIQRDFDHLKDQSWHLLILDESQAIKNHRAKAAQYVRLLNASHRLCMTGTPVENNLAELWSQFDFLMPGFLGPKDRFSRFYRTPIERHGDRDIQKRLATRVAPFMLRRTKDLVIKELPPKTEMLREVELKGRQRDLYETVRAAMEKRVRQEITNKGLARSQIIILDALLKMRQSCCDPSLVKLDAAKKVEESAKMELLCSLLDELLAEDRRILIFSQFTSMLALIEKELNRRKVDYVKLTGRTRDRDTPIQRFQSGEVPVFLISLKAGGSGLNLTAADTVIHYDPWWNPAAEDQATDRAHRIGQEKPVFVYKLIASGTVEEKMQHLKDRKKALANGVYSGSGQKAAALTAKDLDVLFEPLVAES